MPDGCQCETEKRASESSVMILQIQRPGDESPLQFPAVVRNLVGGVATLEVNNPWTSLNWESLKGQKGCLQLLSSGTGKVTEVQGTVTWARYSAQDQDSGQLSLGLQLADPELVTQELISEHIHHTPKDIKGLWDRWDKAQRLPESPPISTKIGIAALGLLLAGLALQLPEPKAFKLFGWVLWFFGTLVVATQALRFWRSRKASR